MGAVGAEQEPIAETGQPYRLARTRLIRLGLVKSLISSPAPARAREALFRVEVEPRSRLWGVTSPVVFLLGAFLAYQRVGASNRVLWAEDASVFFPGEHDHGYLAVVMQGYQGYELFLPRTIALVATAFPLRDLALEYSVMCALITGFIAMVVAKATSPYGAGPIGGIALGLLVPLTPIALFESLDVAANIQWFLAGGCFWALLWSPRERRWIAASTLLVFCGVTSAPLVLTLTPLAIGRLLLVRGRALVVPGAFVVGLAIQLYVMAGSTRTGVRTPGSVTGLLETTVIRLFTVTWLGVTGTENGFRQFGWLTALLVGALWLLIVACCLTTSLSRWLLATSVLAALAMYGAGAFLNYSPAVGPDGSHAVDIVTTGRYANSPTFMLASGTVCALAFAAQKRSFVVPVVVIATLLITVSVVTDFRYPAPRAGGPSWTVSYERNRQACKVDPSGVRLIDVAPVAAYNVSLRCSEILANP